jgi:hypothetical protein
MCCNCKVKQSVQKTSLPGSKRTDGMQGSQPVRILFVSGGRGPWAFFIKAFDPTNTTQTFLGWFINPCVEVQYMFVKIFSET